MTTNICRVWSCCAGKTITITRHAPPYPRWGEEEAQAQETCAVTQLLLHGRQVPWLLPHVSWTTSCTHTHTYTHTHGGSWLFALQYPSVQACTNCCILQRVRHCSVPTYRRQVPPHRGLLLPQEGWRWTIDVLTYHLVNNTNGAEWLKMDVCVTNVFANLLYARACGFTLQVEDNWLIIDVHVLEIN